MNLNNIQKAFFNALLKGERVYYTSLDKKDVVVTDGFYAVVFARDQIKFDLNKCIGAEILKSLIGENEKDKWLAKSDEIRKMNSGEIIRKLYSEDTEIWVKEKYLDLFKASKKGCGNEDRILFYGDFGNFLGCALPVRVVEDRRKDGHHT